MRLLGHVHVLFARKTEVKTPCNCCMQPRTAGHAQRAVPHPSATSSASDALYVSCGLMN